MELNKDEKTIIKILIHNELEYYKQKEEINSDDSDYIMLLGNIIRKLNEGDE